MPRAPVRPRTVSGVITVTETSPAGPTVLRPRRPRARRGASWVIYLLPVLLVLPGAYVLTVGLEDVLGPHLAGTHATLPPPPVLTCSPSALSSAVYVSNPNIVGTYPGGDVLEATFEFQAVNDSPLSAGDRLVVPSLQAIFPTLNGTLALYFAPRNLTLGAGNWSDPTLATVSHPLLATTTFVNGTSSYLSSSNLAVMVTDPSGAIAVGLRWQWSIGAPGGTPLNGSWSQPSPSASKPDLPSIFNPAPFVGVVATNAGAPLAPGQNVTVEINGSIAGNTYRISFEFPNNGSEVSSETETVPANATTYNLTLPIVPKTSTGNVTPGPYLVHIHNVCEAILHSIKIVVAPASIPAARPLGVPGRVGS
jgi:hypothetical protein